MVIQYFSKFILLMLLALLLSNIASAQNVTARIDRTQIQEYESVWLIIRSSSSSSQSPDLAPLEKDFDVLGQSKSSSVNIVNGKMESNSEWSINLMPKRTGELQIPPIAIGDDFTSPITLKVKPASNLSDSNENRNIFIETEVEERQVYVQSQIAYTVKLLYSVGLDGGSLTEPELKNAVIERLGEDISYDTERNGQHYKVIERRYAIFPQNSGELIIPAIEFNGQIIDGSRQPQRRNIFDPFGRQQTRPVRLKSEAVRMTVLPQPDQSTAWIPARKLTLLEQWSPKTPEFRVGEPVTRTIQIQAEGLSASLLPEITLPAVDGIKIYPDQPVTENKTDGSWMTGTRQEKIAMIPTTAGSLTLPEINITWWNTQTKKAQVATLPARNIEVLPALTNGQTEQPVTLTPPSSLLDPTANTNFSSQPPKIDQFPWYWLTLFFGIAWLVTLVAWWKAKHSTQISTPAQVVNGINNSSLRSVKKALKTACNNNDSRQARTALLNWANIVWPTTQWTGLNSIAQQFNNPSLQSAITELDQNLYSNDADTWNGKILWDLISKQEWPKKNSASSHTVLSPLYPMGK
ncbi:MAG: BatD family protein [Gammaproteobacteria bacterium]|nr:BatD family protein [Gammaproteobacteria bacterium]